MIGHPLGEIEKKRDKNQANWMRIEEVVQIDVIVATTTFMVATMTPCFQHSCSVVVTTVFIVATMTQDW